MRPLLLTAFLFICSFVQAQKDLTGHIYSNANIMAKAMKEAMTEINLKRDSIKLEVFKKAEQEKKRKLTAEEKEEIEKELEKELAQIASFEKSIKIGIDLEFMSAKDVVMRLDVAVDETKLKAAGISWLKRKAIKAGLAIIPKKEEGTYVRKGNLIIITDDEEPDTLRISNDEKYIHGTFNKKTKFQLTRRK